MKIVQIILIGSMVTACGVKLPREVNLSISGEIPKISIPSQESLTKSRNSNATRASAPSSSKIEEDGNSKIENENSKVEDEKSEVEKKDEDEQDSKIAADKSNSEDQHHKHSKRHESEK